MQRFKKILVGVDLGWGDRFVTHQLSPPNASAVDQAVWLARLNGASVGFLFALDLSAKAQQLITENSETEAMQAERTAAEQQLQKELAGSPVAAAAKIHLVTHPPVDAITQCIESEKIDLVVMGTVSRTGISGLITGNTAEQLLSRIRCSLLAVKPSGFSSPVQLDDT